MPTQSETSVQQTATVPNVALALQPIVYAEFSALIEPGLGCSFQAEADELLLVATAMDEREDVAEAVVKTDAEAFVIKATQPGGYNALRENGATFTNGVDLSISIERDAGEGVPEGIESTVWPATMILRHDGMARTYTGGRWSCGA